MSALTAVNPKFLRSTRVAMDNENRYVDGAATWKAGQFLYHKNDGLVYTAASNGVKLHYIALQDLDSALSNDTTRRFMSRTHADDVLEMNVFHTTTASALITEADVGNRFALLVASNVCSVDIEDTSNDAFIVVAPSWRNEPFLNTTADTLARVEVSILDSVVNAVAA